MRKYTMIPQHFEQRVNEIKAAEMSIGAKIDLLVNLWPAYFTNRLVADVLGVGVDTIVRHKYRAYET